MTLQDILNYYAIDRIWHFTDRSNLTSIVEHGILSLKFIEKEGIKVSCFGADALSHDLDRYYGLDKFVHLSFIKEHPMHYIKHKNEAIPNPVWIAIKTSVLFDEDVIFSTDVANKTGVPQYGINHLDEKADLEVLWGRTDWSDVEIKQRRTSAKRGEIMIPKMIKLDDILGVA